MNLFLIDYSAIYEAGIYTNNLRKKEKIIRTFYTRIKQYFQPFKTKNTIFFQPCVQYRFYTLTLGFIYTTECVRLG